MFYLKKINHKTTENINSILYFQIFLSSDYSDNIYRIIFIKNPFLLKLY